MCRTVIVMCLACPMAMTVFGAVEAPGARLSWASQTMTSILEVSENSGGV